MARLEDHPTVKKYREKEGEVASATDIKPLDAGWLKKLCKEAGADDVRIVHIKSEAVSEFRQELLTAFPKVKSIISLAFRINRDNLRNPHRSLANVEFHQKEEKTNHSGSEILYALERKGVKGINPSMGFPLEMDKWGEGKVWVVSHKLVAEAAGIGYRGKHRSVIHPVFGSFIFLNTLLIDGELTEYDKPLEYEPCLKCNMCVSACPTGAIGKDGSYNFANCASHTYREFLGGFSDFVETIADSKSALDYRKRVSDSETLSWWQSLSYGANYKSVYCIAACPAGDDVIAPFLEDRKGYIDDVIKPLQDKEENVYAAAGSDSVDYVKKKFPNKTVKIVGNGFRPGSIEGMIGFLPHIFQSGQSKGINCRYHFLFRGDENIDATIVISDQTLDIQSGLMGKANIRIKADSKTFLQFVRKERGIVWALMTGKIRLKGLPTHLLNFGKCFP